MRIAAIFIDLSHLSYPFSDFNIVTPLFSYGDENLYSLVKVFRCNYKFLAFVSKKRDTLKMESRISFRGDSRDYPYTFDPPAILGSCNHQVELVIPYREIART